VPKPVFHSVNGKKSSSLRAQQEVISPQHAELINFIYECELNTFHLLYADSELRTKVVLICSFVMSFSLLCDVPNFVMMNISKHLR
jgi:hypothetical protein